MFSKYIHRQIGKLVSERVERAEPLLAGLASLPYHELTESPIRGSELTKSPTINSALGPKVINFS